MRRTLYLVLFTFLFAKPSSLSIQLTNSILSVYAESGINQEHIKIRGMYLYNDNSNKNNFYLAGIKAEGQLVGLEDSNIKFSLITDFVHTKDNSAVSLGGGFFSFLPNVDLPFFIQAEAAYAPKVLSFNKAYRFSREDVGIGYFVIENGKILIGYRNITFNHNYNSGFYFSLGYNF